MALTTVPRDEDEMSFPADIPQHHESAATSTEDPPQQLPPTPLSPNFPENHPSVLVNSTGSSSLTAANGPNATHADENSPTLPVSPAVIGSQLPLDPPTPAPDPLNVALPPSSPASPDSKAKATSHLPKRQPPSRSRPRLPSRLTPPVASQRITSQRTVSGMVLRSTSGLEGPRTVSGTLQHALKHELELQEGEVERGGPNRVEGEPSGKGGGVDPDENSSRLPITQYSRLGDHEAGGRSAPAGWVSTFPSSSSPPANTRPKASGSKSVSFINEPNDNDRHKGKSGATDTSAAATSQPEAHLVLAQQLQLEQESEERWMAYVREQLNVLFPDYFAEAVQAEQEQAAGIVTDVEAVMGDETDGSGSGSSWDGSVRERRSQSEDGGEHDENDGDGGSADSESGEEDSDEMREYGREAENADLDVHDEMLRAKKHERTRRRTEGDTLDATWSDSSDSEVATPSPDDTRHLSILATSGALAVQDTRNRTRKHNRNHTDNPQRKQKDREQIERRKDQGGFRIRAGTEQVAKRGQRVSGMRTPRIDKMPIPEETRRPSGSGPFALGVNVKHEIMDLKDEIGRLREVVGSLAGELRGGTGMQAAKVSNEQDTRSARLVVMGEGGMTQPAEMQDMVEGGIDIDSDTGDMSLVDYLVDGDASLAINSTARDEINECSENNGKGLRQTAHVAAEISKDVLSSIEQHRGVSGDVGGVPEDYIRVSRAEPFSLVVPISLR